MLKERIILGIDPGSQFAGFGAVRTDGRKIELLSLGVIAPPRDLDFNSRIGIISTEFDALITRLKPDVAVVEQVFLGRNVDSAFKLGHARGVAIASAVRQECEIVEYAARTVKKGITGSGAASKEQVQMILFAALKLRIEGKGVAKADASDALSLAYYHARNLELHEQMRDQIHRQRSQREPEGAILKSSEKESEL